MQRPSFSRVCIFVNLGYSFLAAAVGGYMRREPRRAIREYGAGIRESSCWRYAPASSALQARGKQPIWYQLSLVAVTPLRGLAGGLEFRVLGFCEASREGLRDFPHPRGIRANVTRMGIWI